MRWVIDLDPVQIYRIVSYILFILIIITVFLFFFVKKRYNFRKSRRKLELKDSYQKRRRKSILILLLILIFAFALAKGFIYYLDKSTLVKVDEKIVIIEIDDYWNVNDTKEYFEKFGYTLKDYKEVSDILDKHNVVASLGITPYIFVEQTRENFALRDDEEMIEYLKELDKKGYELAMHGYNHCINVDYCPKYEEVWYNVFNGKLELENIFEKQFITYFPPGNTWTTEQHENVKKAGFLIIGNANVPRAYFDKGVIITQKGYDPIYVYDWYALDFRHTPYEEWIEEYEKKNLFILQLHSNTFDSQEKLDELDKFLEYIKEDDAKIMTYKEFYDYIENRKQGLTGQAIIKT